LAALVEADHPVPVGDQVPCDRGTESAKTDETQCGTLTDFRTETVTEVLQRESVRFTGDVAGPTQRLTIAELRALLAAE
jgi:hypothetical protein